MSSRRTAGRPLLSPASTPQFLAGIATLGLAAVAWVVAAGQMDGMDMGVATPLGSFASFVGLWVPMMAAMMLPGAVDAVGKRVRVTGQLRAAAVFVVTYLAVWTVVGLAVYAIDRPHNTGAAGAVVIAAGCYELTPLKQHFRERCRASVRPFEFGLACVGSSVGLMAMLAALGVMSVAWMAVIAAVIVAQKLLPATRAIDMPLAVVIVGLGVWIVVAPSAIPGLMYG
jgi:predicted metal-binding membrane protein